MSRPDWVITSCGKLKMDGPGRADQFYRGPDVIIQAETARALKPRKSRIILSNKYGFMLPSFVIPAPYDSHWGYDDTLPLEMLREQVDEIGVRSGDLVVVLGTREYARNARRVIPAEIRVIWPPLHLSDKRPGYQRQLNKTIQKIGKLPQVCVEHCEMSVE